ncbi:MAG TPA: patatin-like phospholipase family protein [Anaerolineales bacterium]|nr:patatin-like phospholipase family protein [Anaerolineales bacterium]
MSRAITLALGGGGVKGNAHLGVLRVLEQHGIEIGGIAGTSAGGLWGALYASGLSVEQVLEQAKNLDYDEAYRRLPDDEPSWMGVAGIRKLLGDILGDKTFADLRFPFAVTAVDLDTAELVIIRSGKVLDAVLATIAVPGIFPPVHYDGRLLVDGGILAPVPVSLARSLAPELPVAAVVLSPPIDHWKSSSKPRLMNSLPFLARYLARLRVAQALNVFLRAMDISGAQLTELFLALEKPEVIIRPAVGNIGLLDDVDAHEVANAGELAALEVLPELERQVSWPMVWRRRMKQMVAPHE